MLASPFIFIFALITEHFCEANPKATNYVSPLTTSHCEQYKKECLDPSCPTTEECTPPEDGRRNHCYVLWQLDKNQTPIVHMKGCFLHNEQCFDQERCVSREASSKMLYCCCDGNYCNKEFFWEPAPTTTPLPAIEQKPEPSSLIINAIVAAIVVLVIARGTLFYIYYYKRSRHPFNEVPSEDPGIFQSDTPFQGLLPIQLVEIKARGRFGAVWKGKNKTEEVAVKIFPGQDKQSWLTEQEIYKLAQMDHPNILHFIAAEKRGAADPMQVEYWLITAYHERGSLSDFLEAHTLTWTELCHVVETMARGLVHLHEEVPSKGNYKGKPSVAHRDFKSKNVLLKNDLTACIADFGLALVFEPGKSCGDTHGQVGTRRYMAPEMLEGAISFTPDAFLGIDMYACGLVLWELVSRCTAQDSPVPEYRLPFEEEVGQHPTLEDMQESVVQRKVRPVIQNTWRNHAGLSAMCDTMEECWDHDAEARLSASCVMELVMLESRYQNCMISLRIENESVLGTGKESSM